VSAGRRLAGRHRNAPRLYAIADAETLGAASGRLDPLLEAVSILAGAGVRWIQLRAKRLCGRDLFAAVEGALERLAAHPEVALWVNDRVDVASCLPVAGVHLGQLDLPAAAARRVLGDGGSCLPVSGVHLGHPARRVLGDGGSCLPVSGVHLEHPDLPAAAARRVLGSECWIGLSTHTVEQGRSAQEDGAVDVVAVGPVYSTRSKEGADPAVGLAGVERARALGDKPLVAIGGIDVERAAAVIAAGADSVAVIGALGRGREIEVNARRLLAAVS